MKTILRFIKPYKGLCFFTILVMLLDVLGTLFVPTLVADMINAGVLKGDIHYIYQKGFFMLGAALLSGIGTLIGSFLVARLAARVTRDMRNALYDKSLLFAEHDFERFGTSSMITRSLNDVNKAGLGLVMTTQMILPVPVMCVMAVTLAFMKDSLMGSFLLIVTIVVLVTAGIVTKKAGGLFVKLQKAIDRINVVIRENISGVRVIRAFNKEQYEQTRTRNTFLDYANYAVKANYLFMGLESVTMFVVNVCIVGIVWFGGNQVGAGLLEIGDITALTEYAILILFYVMMAIMVMMFLPHAAVCAKRIGEVLDCEPKIKEGNGRADNDSDIVCSFAHLAVRFADAEEATLHRLNFKIKRGTTTAIIGSTGSGKTTIAKLIQRLHDVSDGTLSICGKDVRTLTADELHACISYVPQKAWLFSGTIADNLRYGKENATEEEMWNALEIAQSGFVRELPEGVHSRVAQGGTNFSGGQKQRLAIARALMKKSDLYIFDDSFSALDFKTDAALRKTLKTAVSDSAVLIIAQRVSTITSADQIIVLEEGAAVGIGKHEELLVNCATYADIVKSQTRGGTANV